MFHVIIVVDSPAPMPLASSTLSTLVMVERDDSGVATVIINRPESLNALNKSMLMDLAKAFKDLDADDTVGVIILTGKGKAFSAGVDMKAADGVFKGGAADKDLEYSLGYQMEKCRKPIIGAINGFAITGAFEIALSCDILIASRSAIFMDTHVRFVPPLTLRHRHTYKHTLRFVNMSTIGTVTRSTSICYTASL